ncbi:MAG: hypothetical protein ABJ327_12885 [Litoreibacter sp.]
MKLFLLGALTFMPFLTLADVGLDEQGYLFAGTPYTRANGHIAQNSTTFRISDAGKARATGWISHREEMGSFGLVFSVDCNLHLFTAHADINARFSEQSGVSFRSFPEWLEVRFPDGTVGSIGSHFAAPSAVAIASERFREYLEAGEPQTPAHILINGLTNRVISRHPHRVRFIVEGMIARSCLYGRYRRRIPKK